MDGAGASFLSGHYLFRSTSVAAVNQFATNFKLCFGALFFSLFIVSSSRVSAAEEKDYLPVKLGNEWFSDITVTSPDGQIVTGRLHRVLSDVVQLDGKQYIRERTNAEMDKGPNREFITRLLRKDEAGLHFKLSDAPGAKEKIAISQPLVVGEKWISDSKKLKQTVIGLETITVAGKVYENCYHICIELPDGSFRDDFYEAPIVGAVKDTVVYPDGTKFEILLREFRPGKK